MFLSWRLFFPEFRLPQTLIAAQGPEIISEWTQIHRFLTKLFGTWTVSVEGQELFQGSCYARIMNYELFLEPTQWPPWTWSGRSQVTSLFWVLFLLSDWGVSDGWGSWVEVSLWTQWFIQIPCDSKRPLQSRSEHSQRTLICWKHFPHPGWPLYLKLSTGSMVSKDELERSRAIMD